MGSRSDPMSGAAFVSGALFLSIIASSCTRPGEGFTQSASPQGTYQLTLSGSSSKPQRPLLNYATAFEAINTRSGSRIAGQLYIADQYDPAFTERYPKQLWLQENAVRFLAKDHITAEFRTSIELRNALGRPLSHVIIHAGDMILLLEPGAGSALTFEVPRHGARTFLGFEAHAAGGRSVAATKDIDIEESASGGPLECQIVIKPASDISCHVRFGG